MPVYECTIISSAGQQYVQKLDAANVAALRSLIDGRREFLIAQRELKEFARARRTKLRPKTLVQLYHLIGMLMKSGVLAQDAIARLKEDFPDPAARRVLAGIHANLSVARETLSGAMAQYPRSFPESVIGTVRVGEENGKEKLAERFEDLRDQVAFEIGLRKTTMRAVAYPAFVMTFASAVVVFVMVKVVPQFLELLNNLNTQMPAPTRFLVGVSAFFRAYYIPGLILLGMIVTAWLVCRRLPSPALAIDRLLLRTPFIGAVLQALTTAAVAKHYRAMYSAGVPAGPTLTACAGAVSNRAVRAALLRAQHFLESGVLTAKRPDAPAITEALRSTGYFPPLALTIIGTGEPVGSLDVALESVAKHYAQEAAERIEVFFAVFNKILFLAVLVVCGWVAVSIYLPIITASQSLGHH